MEEYLLRFEIQEAREGIFLMPRKKFEMEFTAQNAAEAHSKSNELVKEEINRIKETGIIMHEPKKFLYKRI